MNELNDRKRGANASLGVEPRMRARRFGGRAADGQVGIVGDRSGWDVRWRLLGLGLGGDRGVFRLGDRLAGIGQGRAGRGQDFG
ncbi:MAG: hypothetical protein KatS3mg108_3437 [Isosphaeraceae bacterium]|nr:MAG: hypothetical protein KatS3mg108_3437 [Isosphaeraceae bacterium]